MIRLLSVFVLTAFLSNTLHAATPPCGVDDIACIRLQLLQKADEAASLAKELGLSRQHEQILNKTIEVLKSDNATLAAVIKPASDALKISQRTWYEHPGLWLSIGVFGGIMLTILAVWGVGQLRSSLAR